MNESALDSLVRPELCLNNRSLSDIDENGANYSYPLNSVTLRRDQNGHLCTHDIRQSGSVHPCW